MTNLFSFKKGLWKGITTNHPSLLTKATKHKLDILIGYIYDEVQPEFELSNQLTNDIVSLFTTKVWNYDDEEDYEVPLETLVNLLLESIETECRRCNFTDEKIKSILKVLRLYTDLCPEALILLEAKLRCELIYPYIVEKMIELDCPGELAIQIIPTAREIEHRLMLDAVEYD